MLLTNVGHEDLHNGSTWHPDEMHTLAIAIRRYLAGRALRETVTSNGAVYLLWYVGALT